MSLSSWFGQLCDMLFLPRAAGGLSFELVVGQNGRVWVNAPDTAATVAVANAIQQSEGLSEKQAATFAQELLNGLQATRAVKTE